MSQSGSGSMTIYDVCFALVVCLALVWLGRRSRRDLPPGPRGLPLVGNLFDFPNRRPGDARERYRQLAMKYGDVVSLNICGQTLLVLSSKTAITDLLEKRSSIYSDRTASPLVKLADSEWPFAIKRYGDHWRQCRRLFWQYFNPNAVKAYHSLQVQFAQELGRCLRHYEEDLHSQVRLSMTRVLLTVAHGVQDEGAARRYLFHGDEVPEVFPELAGSGTLLVNFVPWLRHLPRWLPGAGWMRELPRWRSGMKALLEMPYQVALDAIARGDAKPSMVSDMLDKLQKDGLQDNDERHLIKEVTSQVPGAGVDTMTETLLTFFRAMALYPDIQKRAQEEVDAVVGAERLPEHADKASLPYVQAVLNECLRWNVILPFGLVHRCQEENEYRGWRIPEGSLVMVNVWMLLNDPDVFPEPEVFRPERYLKDDELDPDAPNPAVLVFGFGRRVCPGRHFAEDLLFVHIAAILQTCDIKLRQSNASDQLQTGTTVQYTIRPRSSVAETLIRGEALSENLK